MKSAAKWFVVGGALLLIISFLLPIISVSNSGTRVSISLLQIAGVGYWFFLYLAPLCALVVLLLELVPVNDPTTRKIFLAGQAAGIVGVLLLLLGALVYTVIQPQLLGDPAGLGSLLSPNFQTGEISIWPGIGLFTLLLGVAFAIFGMVTNVLPMLSGNSAKEQSSQAVQPIGSTSAEEPVPVVQEAYLEGKKGSFAGKKFPLKGENFSIGRGRDNDLQLSDRRVSRLHTRVRYSQGSWFVQDQDSKIGTQINGKPVKATRLSSGDSIKIGDEVFIFHFNQDAAIKQ